MDQCLHLGFLLRPIYIKNPHFFQFPFFFFLIKKGLELEVQESNGKRRGVAGTEIWFSQKNQGHIIPAQWNE